MSNTKNYNGVIVNQNTRATDSYQFDIGVPFVQEFFLPSDYKRGDIIPDITAIQIEVAVADPARVNVQFSLEYLDSTSTWRSVSDDPTLVGSATAAPYSSPRQWITLHFQDSLRLTNDMLGKKFRIKVINNDISGVSRFFYSTPNPYSNANGYVSTGATTVPHVGFRFRVLSSVADEGTDYLGNTYRSATFTSSPSDVTLNAEENKSWLSKPNPSRFAIESLYFSVSEGSDPAVIDRVVVDPTTPGVYFNIYYSANGTPGRDSADWDALNQWTRVPQTFHATKRETHTLGTPIKARLIKIEFCHLQARYYSPGEFAKPIKYNKHPKWVLDYFLARVSAQKAVENKLLGGSTAVIYDALDLAYNYYLDDLNQEPDEPIKADAGKIAEIQKFAQTNNDLSDQVDPITLEKVNLVLSPYQSDPSVFTKDSYLLSTAIQNFGDYPSEDGYSRFPDIGELRNESVILESDYPVMFFYLTCFHKYREVLAELSHDRAYFVGIREIAFLRDHYGLASDTTQYNEPVGDFANTQRSDFTFVDGQMRV
jgi:hypothetical protein